MSSVLHRLFALLGLLCLAPGCASLGGACCGQSGFGGMSMPFSDCVEDAGNGFAPAQPCGCSGGFLSRLMGGHGGCRQHGCQQGCGPCGSPAFGGCSQGCNGGCESGNCGSGFDGMDYGSMAGNGMMYGDSGSGGCQSCQGQQSFSQYGPSLTPIPANGQPFQGTMGNAPPPPGMMHSQPVPTPAAGAPREATPAPGSPMGYYAPMYYQQQGMMPQQMMPQTAMMASEMSQNMEMQQSPQAFGWTQQPVMQAGSGQPQMMQAGGYPQQMTSPQYNQVQYAQPQYPQQMTSPPLAAPQPLYVPPVTSEF